MEPGREQSISGIEDFINWYKENKETVNRAIDEYGGVLLRRTCIENDAGFARFVDIAADNGTLNYVSGNSPRLKVTGGVYTSTELAADREIQIHNELSYAPDWPARIFFCCIIPAVSGGETPLANCHSIYEDLPAHIRDEFENKQVAYIRNLHGGTGMGISWQETFETDNTAAITELLSRSGTIFEWKPDNSLWMKQVRPAIISHPKKGCKVWFNQADEFHPSANGIELYEAMLDLSNGDISKFPVYVQFGDNTEIPLEYLETVRQVVRKNTIKFPWQQGDIVMLDNVLIGHGRMPYGGERRILVAMTR
jgi:alpha-ketoglutarate-dependent taurine dioxygenase